MATFYIQQFGCRATQADGAALERQLLDRGCTQAPDPSSASIVVLNTCTVTAAADAQARDAIRRIHAQNPTARLLVTGCYAQRAPEELAALTGVSWVVGNSHKPQIPNILTQIAPAAPVRTSGEQLAIPMEARNLFFPSALPDVPFHSFQGVGMVHPLSSGPAPILRGNIFFHPEFVSAPIHGGESHHTRPILKIQDGCNLRCSYCVIPFVRGKSRSLASDSVVSEIQTLIESGAREVVLSGINLGTYGRDLSPRVEFIDLLRRVLDETPIERLRISSIEPLDVTRDLIDLFASHPRIAQHLHIPLQSASDRILAAMHRWYRSEHYARRIELIEDRLPHAALGADVIAGFPGETESDHAATLAFIRRHPFTYLHVFSYSSRPGTKAAAARDHVSAAVIKRRARELRSLGEAKAAAFRRTQKGRTLRVLTLHRNDHTEASVPPNAHTTPAISSNYLRVHVPGFLPANLWQDIVVKSEEGNYLLGELRSPHCESCAHGGRPDPVEASLR